MSVEIVAALIAVGGVVFTGAVALVVHHVTNRSQNQALFQSALEFITGETQKRSVGISLLADYARSHPGKADVIFRIFRAQLLHLVDKGYDAETGWERRIERYNYLLLKELIGGAVPGRADLQGEAGLFYENEIAPGASKP